MPTVASTTTKVNAVSGSVTFLKKIPSRIVLVINQYFMNVCMNE